MHGTVAESHILLYRPLPSASPARQCAPLPPSPPAPCSACPDAPPPANAQRVRILPLPDELAITSFPIEPIAGRQAKRAPALIWLCGLISQIAFAPCPH